MSVLGCGPVTAMILERGGKKVANLGSSFGEVSVIEWNRRLDRISRASAYIDNAYGCCGWWEEVRPFQHELALFRDGERFWRGPVTSVRYVRDQNLQAVINAGDLAQWLDLRLVHNDLTFPKGTDLAFVASAIINDAMAVDPSPDMLVTVSPCGSVISEDDGRRVLGSQHKVAYDVIRELSQTGFDWTVIDSHFLGGGAQVPVGLPQLVLFDEHFRNVPDIGFEGSLFATRFHVVGTGRGEAGDTIHAVNPAVTSLESVFGVVERVFSEPDIRDLATASDSAGTRFDLFGRFGVPRIIEGAILSQDAPVAVKDLIPGRLVKVSIDPCPDWVGTYRLSSVDGYHGPEADTVTISLEPIGTTDHREAQGGSGGGD